MKELCHDCNIKPLGGKNFCIGHELICTLHNKENIVGETKGKLDQ